MAQASWFGPKVSGHLAPCCIHSCEPSELSQWLCRDDSTINIIICIIIGILYYHTRALNAGINDPPKEWRRPRGRPRQTWLQIVENDLKHQNLGLWSARHRAYDRDLWRDIVEMATLLQGHAT